MDGAALLSLMARIDSWQKVMTKKKDFDDALINWWRIYQGSAISIGTTEKQFTHEYYFLYRPKKIGYYLIPHVTFLEGSAIGIGIFRSASKAVCTGP